MSGSSSFRSKYTPEQILSMDFACIGGRAGDYTSGLAFDGVISGVASGAAASKELINGSPGPGGGTVAAGVAKEQGAVLGSDSVDALGSKGVVRSIGPPLGPAKMESHICQCTYRRLVNECITKSPGIAAIICLFVKGGYDQLTGTNANCGQDRVVMLAYVA